jgi:hypothetical protein
MAPLPDHFVLALFCSRNEGLPLSLFHPFKRLPPEGTVSSLMVVSS